MSYDRMGRRVTKNNQRFVYDGYLQIANSELQTLNSKLQTFIWDPTEPVATRPLVWTHGNSVAYYTHDGNKNVSEIVAENGDIVAHYEYSPFGMVMVTCSSTTTTAYDFCVYNPFGHSSEYNDYKIGLVYYNYRHYNSLVGNWCTKDPIEERGGINIYGFIGNNTLYQIDNLGLGWTWRYGVPVFMYPQCCNGKEFDPAKECCIDKKIFAHDKLETGVSYYCYRIRWYYPIVQPVLRPFSPRQFMVDHCWFNVDGFRFGAYPNGRFPDKKSIRDESKMRSKYNAAHEGSFWTTGGSVRLSPCQYDIEKFKKCILGKYDDISFKWTLWNNCRDFVIDSVRECKKQSQR
jgi:RHS repeat-associated protein